MQPGMHSTAWSLTGPEKRASKSIISARTVCQTSGSLSAQTHHCCCFCLLPPPSPFMSSSNPEQQQQHDQLRPYPTSSSSKRKKPPPPPSHQSGGCQAESVASAAAEGAVSSDLDRQPLLCQFWFPSRWRLIRLPSSSNNARLYHSSRTGSSPPPPPLPSCSATASLHRQSNPLWESPANSIMANLHIKKDESLKAPLSSSSWYHWIFSLQGSLRPDMAGLVHTEELLLSHTAKKLPFETTLTSAAPWRQ